MKAWGCMNYNIPCGVIVFAETRGKARSLAMTQEGLDGSEWTEIDVKRLPKLDKDFDVACILDWQDGRQTYYEAGWWGEDGAPMCVRCERYEYAEIPESYCDEELGDELVCVACMKKQTQTLPIPTEGSEPCS